MGGAITKKGLCPKYGRYWVDQPGQHERLRKVISFGEVTQTMAERKLRDHIRENAGRFPGNLRGSHLSHHYIQTASPAAGWMKCEPDESSAERSVSRSKPATLAGYQAAVNWLNETIGNTALADIKNEVAKQLVIRMREANLADKTIVNYFQVVKGSSCVSRVERRRATLSTQLELPFHRPSGHRREKTTQAFFNCIRSRTNSRESEGPLQSALCTSCRNRTPHR